MQKKLVIELDLLNGLIAVVWDRRDGTYQVEVVILGDSWNNSLDKGCKDAKEVLHYIAELKQLKIKE